MIQHFRVLAKEVSRDQIGCKELILERAMGSLEEKFISVCDEHLSQHEGYEIRGEQGLFSFAMVVWLGVQARLKGNSLQASLSALVERAKNGTGIDFLISRTNRKVRDAAISGNTGGLSRARNRFSLESVRELFYAATEQVFKCYSIKAPHRNVYVLDGQVVAIARTDSNLEHFCRTGNGEGELHFPRIRAISAHEVGSGVAREVAIGDWKQSEVGLSCEVARRLPPGSLIIMDRGFAKPHFLHEVLKEDVEILVRMKDSHGKKLLGEAPAENAERLVEWIPKQGVKIKLSGRIIRFKSQISGFRSSEFYFFTTNITLPLEEIAELYRKRVQVEVFIRDIKQTLKMAFIRSRTGENIEKEILIAYLTFNLLRAVMEHAANALSLPVGRLSFTATISWVTAYAPLFAAAKSAKEHELLAQQFYQHLRQTKLPLRIKERSYPRVIKFPRDKYKTAGIFKTSQQGER